MKAFGEVEKYLNAFLTSALGGSEQSAFKPRPLYPLKKKPHVPAE
jgi:hypothetical protein